MDEEVYVEHLKNFFYYVLQATNEKMVFLKNLNIKFDVLEEFSPQEAFDYIFKTKVDDKDEITRSVFESVFSFKIADEPDRALNACVYYFKVKYYLKNLSPKLIGYIDDVKKYDFEKCHSKFNEIRNLHIENTSYSSNTIPLYDDKESKDCFDDLSPNLNLLRLKSPWKSIDDHTGGFDKEEITLFGARPGVGKTTLSLLLALHSYKDNKKVLIVSPEMSYRNLLFRILAIESGINVSSFRKRELTEMQFKKVVETFHKLKSDFNFKNFHIMKNDKKVSMLDLYKTYGHIMPDLVILDGMYMLETSEKCRDRFERMGKLMQEIKTFATTSKCHLICTTQLNRSSTEKEKVGLENFALSDELGWYTDFAFILNKVDGGPIVEVSCVKSRSTEKIEPFKINWDYKNSNFTEVGDNKFFNGIIPF